MPVFTNGVPSMAVCPLGDASIICRVIDASLISRMKALEEENKRFKKMCAEKSMQNDLLRKLLEKCGKAVSQERDGRMGRAPSDDQYPACLSHVLPQ